MLWRRRVFKIDIETCSKFGVAVKVIACIEDPVVIDKIAQMPGTAASGLVRLTRRTTEFRQVAASHGDMAGDLLAPQLEMGIQAGKQAGE
jgi:hypothetical protein